MINDIRDIQREVTNLKNEIKNLKTQVDENNQILRTIQNNIQELTSLIGEKL